MRVVGNCVREAMAAKPVKGTRVGQTAPTEAVQTQDDP